MQTVLRKIAELKFDPTNPLTHDDEDLNATAASHKAFKQQKPIVINEEGEIIAGNGYAQAALRAGETEIWCVVTTLPPARQRAYKLADNKTGRNAEWNDENVEALLREIKEGEDPDLIGAVGYSEEELEKLIAGLEEPGAGTSPEELAASAKTLVERFGVPPFSVLDARQGYWKVRKAAWLSLGIESEVGRGENLLKMSDTVRSMGRKAGGPLPGGGTGPKSVWQFKTKEGMATGEEAQLLGSGTSIFDPVLTELLLRWFCPPGGFVYDPFAGGSVRGIVAARLGRHYLGVELRPEQIDANGLQAMRLIEPQHSGSVAWLEGDAVEVTRKIPAMFPDRGKADFVLACPHYFDLEQYSENPADLSAQTWEKFQANYRRVIKDCVKLLDRNRFAAFVVANVRDDEGNFRDLVGLTVRAFEDAGASLYNDGVLVTSCGSAALRAQGIFGSGKKLVKTHQNVLVFVKGEGRAASDVIGPIDFGIADLPADEATAAEGITVETETVEQTEPLVPATKTKAQPAKLGGRMDSDGN